MHREILFKNFPPIFNSDNLAYSICRQRAVLYEVPKYWINQNKINVSIDDFKIDESQNRYSVCTDRVPFEILYLPRKTRKIFISLSGGGREGKDYPLFLRWKYFNFFDGHYLAIDDPMLYDAKFKCVHWYYGTHKESYLKSLLKIVKCVTNQLEIKNENVIFFGSSGGGYAAIYCANILDGSTAIAFNPQYNLSKWNSAITKHFLDDLNINLQENDIHCRNYLRITNKKSIFFLVENVASTADLQQFEDFAMRHSLPIKYGVSQFHNIITWLHHSTGISNHSTNPERLGFVIINYLLNQYRRGCDINHFTNFSYLINELLNEKHVNLKQLHTHTHTQFFIYFFYALYRK